MFQILLFFSFLLSCAEWQSFRFCNFFKKLQKTSRNTLGIKLNSVLKLFWLNSHVSGIMVRVKVRVWSNFFTSLSSGKYLFSVWLFCCLSANFHRPAETRVVYGNTSADVEGRNRWLANCHYSLQSFSVFSRAVFTQHGDAWCRDAGCYTEHLMTHDS